MKQKGGELFLEKIGMGLDAPPLSAAPVVSKVFLSPICTAVESRLCREVTLRKGMQYYLRTALRAGDTARTHCAELAANQGRSLCTV